MLLAEQKEPLLDLELDRVDESIVKRSRMKFTFVSLLLALYSVVVSMALIFTLRSSVSGGANQFPSDTKSVVMRDLPQEIQQVHAHPGSVLAGPPSPEHDKAWSDLLRPLFVNVSSVELLHVGVEPGEQLRLFDGGYIASLEVYHHLHCVRRLKWHLYESYYFTNISDSARVLEHNHMNHCIESLRIALMCSADTSLYTLKWRGEGKRPEPISKAERVCTVWRSLEDWALPRSVPNSPRLINPDKLRDAFDNDHSAV